MLDSKIETFLTVVKYKSYTLTAQKLHMTQPAITQHIHKLEAHYGCLLVDSTNRSIKITVEGELLYKYLTMQLANEHIFERLLHNINSPFCIGATLSIADYYLFEVISKQLLCEDERIRIIVENTTNLIEKLRTGSIDCAFIEGMFDQTFFESHVFRSERFIPVVSSLHPLAHKSVYMKDLYTFPLILREPNSGTREILENWFYQKNIQLQSFQKTIEIGSFAFIKKLIHHSHAITFVYEGVVKEELEDKRLCQLHIKDFQLCHDMHFVYRKGDPNQNKCIALLQSLSL